ncbi:tetratricopeptide repeat protein [Nostoc sp. UHCC 0702]|nr:tetratricopeptide repeat protein [Nostoc sp. UHCC 0702]
MLWNVLQAIRRQITQKLGLSPSNNNKDTTTTLISNSQLEFLLQVIKATADSGGDAKVIHPLLKANQEKLDMNFAQVLRSWAMATLADLEIDTARNTVIDIINFSNRMQDFPLGNRANNLEIAITGYEIALTVFIQDRFPYEWATTQNNLGNAYSNRIRGEKAENLELAISCYEAALSEYTRDRFPYDWARTQNNLGAAYNDRIRGEKAENLELAISCYEAALLEYTRDRFPYDWAMTQNNLGNAYSNRIRGEKAENLELAISCYEAALLERTRDRFPYEWATTQNNLGAAYNDRIRGEKAENLELAISCYEAALSEYTRDRFPYDWARTQNNLGAAYNDRIRGEKAENLELAISCYEAALLEYTRDRFPYDWAMTQNNLGNAYSNRIRGEKAENLELAISCYEAALLERTRDRFPYEWATTQNNLGAAYSNRIRGEKAENLELAISCYEAALLERTRDRFPYDWAMTQNNLGNAYNDRIRGEKAENLELAISCYEAALLERTREAFPQNHATTAFNLGLAYTDAKHFADAYKIFKSAIDTVEFLRGEIFSGDEVKQKLAEEWNKLYHCMVEVCLELKYDDEAVEYIERSKTRNLVELLANQGSPALQQLEQQISEEKRRLAADNPEATTLNQLRQQRQELIKQVIPLEQIRFGEIPGLLDEDTAILQWYIFNDCFRAFIITRQDQTPRIWKSTAEDLQDLDKWSKEYLETYYTKKDQWRHQLTNKLTELADKLHINDVLDLVPDTCKALIFVPHRYLHLLPLHALPLKDLTPNPLPYEGIGLNSKPLSLQERGLERGQKSIEQIDLTPNPLADEGIGLNSKPLSLQERGLERGQKSIEQTDLTPNPLADEGMGLNSKPLSLQERGLERGQKSIEQIDLTPNPLADEGIGLNSKPLSLQERGLERGQKSIEQTDLTPNPLADEGIGLNSKPLSLQERGLERGQKSIEQTDLTPNPLADEGIGLNSKPLSLQERGLERGQKSIALNHNPLYLLDRFPGGVRYAPSCQLLKLAKKREYQPQQKLFAIQDPNDNLTYTNIEVETIQRYFHPTTVLKKAQASKQALLEAVAKSPDMQVVHLSCHGYFDSKSPVNSAIALADCISATPPASSRYLELPDGNKLDLEKCLTLVDIFNLNLPQCRLVTLSACETALTKSTTSDEYIGLASGFLKAGSSSVVSSLWSVDDFATTLLMIRFYDNLHSLPVAQALCQAQQWLRHTTQTDFINWTQQHPNINKQNKQTIQQYLQTWYEPEEKPFDKPDAWASFSAIGH